MDAPTETKSLKKYHYSTEINAPRDKVWEVLWNDESYRKWTSAFMEGSYAESDWEEGSKILFLGPDGSGMYSKIASKVPNEYMSFEHLGEVKDGKKVGSGEKTEQWAGIMENYTLEDHNGGTKLSVEVDYSGEEWEKMLRDLFPKALGIVKELSENGK